MNTRPKPEFAISTIDFCRILIRHKAKMIWCFALAMGLAVAIMIFWPRKYQSQSKLFVRVGRETVTLDPSATTSQVIPVSLSRETEVNSVLEMLRSRVIIEKLVDEIGPAAILRPASESKSGEPTTPSFLSSLLSYIKLDPVSEREAAIERVSRLMSTGVEKNSDVITITGICKSPELAKTIVEKYVDVYLGEHSRMHRTAGSQAFFTEQTALLKEKMSDALTKLGEAKSKLGIVSVENERLILQNETTEVEIQLAQSQASLAAAQKKSEALRTRFARLADRLPTEEVKGFPNMAADNMRNSLYMLEVREAELASRFTDEFPALTAVREQINLAKHPLRSEEQRRTQSTTTVNAVHNQTELNLLNEEANVESLSAEVIALENQAEKLRERTRLLNEHEAQIANLEQQAILCKANYATYCEKAEQSRIDAELQNERITNVNVVQPATFVEKPVSPKKTAVLVLGLFGGIGLSIGVALLSENLDSSGGFRAKEKEPLSRPVIAPIPKVAKYQEVLT